MGIIEPKEVIPITIALAAVVIALNLKADIAILQSDLPWWAKLKLLTR